MRAHSRNHNLFIFVLDQNVQSSTIGLVYRADEMLIKLHG
jgi:hypothetical protein